MNIFRMSLPVLALSMAALAAPAAMAHHMDKSARGAGQSTSQSMANMQMTDTYKQSNAAAKDSKATPEKNAVTVQEPEAKNPSALLTPEIQWWKDR